MRNLWLVCGLLCCALLPATVRAGEADPFIVPEMQVEKLVSLARSGNNQEAIAFFEALPADAELPLVAMRAIAGCYWRERHFEKSRELYQRILDRRPTLHKLSKNPEAGARPLLSKSEQTEADAEARVEVAEARAREAESRAAAVAEQVEKAREAVKLSAERELKETLRQKEELAGELEALRKANAALEKQREELRTKTGDRISSLVSSAEGTSAEVNTLRRRLEAERERRTSAEEVAEQIQRGFEHEEKKLKDRVGELSKTLDAARKELIDLRKARKAEDVAHKKALAQVKSEHKQTLEKERAQLEDTAGRASVAQKELGKREEELSGRIRELDDALKAAQGALKQNRTDAGRSAEEARKREEVLLDRVSALESLSQSAGDEIAELARALEVARLKNAELSAKRVSVEKRAEDQIDAMEDSALRGALREIDSLEREYAALDDLARKRQQELLARIDMLEQSTVTSDSELAAVRQQLDLERKLRQALEVQGEKRDEALLEANRVLAAATQKMAEQFDAMRAQAAASPELRLSDDAKRPADLAPLIGKLEEATESAALEAKELRELLAQERQKHEAERAANQKEIASLRRKVEVLNKEIDALKTASARREAELKAEMAKAVADTKAAAKENEAALRAEMDRKLKEASAASKKLEKELAAARKQSEGALQDAAREREKTLRAESREQLDALKATHSIQVRKLEAEITRLGEQIEGSTEALEKTKRELAGQRKAYEKLVIDTDGVETVLRERIRDLELAFNLPASAVAAPRGEDSGDTELEERVESLHRSIIDTAKEDKDLAITQFESLPAESVKPVSLLKTIANLYRQKQQHEKAHAIYEEILTRAPGDLYAERKLVMTLFDMGRYDEALERLAGPQGRSE